VARVVYGLQNIPLRDPEMFQHFPRRMRTSLRALSSGRSGKILDDLVEFQVRAIAVQQVQHMFA
jgi:hypothetical protein